MKYYVGIDMGTSSVKLLLMDENGRVVGVPAGATGYLNRFRDGRK